MDSSSNLDRISMLSDYLLVLIISYLPFKDALKTSLLSKRWRNINRETRNISFKEAEIVQTYPNVLDEHAKRAMFVQYSIDWVSNFTGGVIETFELSMPNPVGYETEMQFLIEFAANKKVKNLVLDFSDQFWVDRDEVASEEDSMIQMPESVYDLTTLVTLKLLACRFDSSKLAEAGSVESLYFGWMPLATITSLLSKTPLLQMLRIKNCWNVGLEAITGFNNRLIKLVFKNSRFIVPYSTLDLPSLLIFKFAGKVHHLEFKKVNRGLEEVDFDYGRETEYHDGLGTQICDFLCNLASTTTLTVCPFLIQVIQHSADPGRLKAEMQTKRLVLKTNLEPFEFVGIRFMINSCPHLETLTFQLVVTMPVDRIAPQFDPVTYWNLLISHTCLEETLKNVEMWNFCGGQYELLILKYIIGVGRVLERVDLYLPSGMSNTQLQRAQDAAEMVGTTFEASSESLTIFLH